jgi:hypothetical protein
MVDTPVADQLPTVAQMRAFHNASFAAWHARRLREASRGVITGHTAFAICMFPTSLVIAGSGVAPFIFAGLIPGYVAVLFLSIRWVKRERAQSLVTVVDRREEEARTAVVRPWKVFVALGVIFAFQLAFIAGVKMAFHHMSGSAIVASLSIGPIVGILYFVRRFVLFSFWEDLLFAACVALSHLVFLLNGGRLIVLSFIALLLVALGTASLQGRWVKWTRSLPDPGNEEDSGKVQP